MLNFDPNQKKDGVNECIIATCNNIVFSYDLWLLDILSEHYSRIEEDDFDWAVSEITKILEYNSAIPFTVTVSDKKKLIIVPKDGGMFNPELANNMFIYLKTNIVFGHILAKILKKYEKLCYTTTPTHINPNSTNFLRGRYNYFVFVEKNLVDDERILRNIFGVGELQGFKNTKEDIIKAFMDMTGNMTTKAQIFFLSDNFWIDIDLFNDIVNLGIDSSPVFNYVDMSGKVILETPDNIKQFKNFEEALKRDTVDPNVPSFSLGKLWDVGK